LIVLAEFDDVEEAAAPIFDRLGFMAAESEPEELSIKRLRCSPATPAGCGTARG
jgi:hypothetical protein